MAEIDNPDDNHIIDLNNPKQSLHYQVINSGKKLKEIPVFKNWLNLQKENNGNEGVICYCSKCKDFYYFSSLAEKSIFHDPQDCPSSDFAQFCEYCGELYNRNSICCIRQGIAWIKRMLYESFEGDCQDCCFIFPFISTIYLFSVFFHLIMSLRGKKIFDINFKRDFTISDKAIIWIFVPITVIYSLVFFITYMFLYIFFIMIFELIIRHQKIKDRAENNQRY